MSIKDAWERLRRNMDRLHMMELLLKYSSLDEEEAWKIVEGIQDFSSPSKLYEELVEKLLLYMPSKVTAREIAWKIVESFNR